MYVKFEEVENGLIIKTGFEDNYDPINESLKKVVLDSVKKLIKHQITRVNDELYKAKQKETALIKEINEIQKAKGIENGVQ